MHFSIPGGETAHFDNHAEEEPPAMTGRAETRETTRELLRRRRLDWARHLTATPLRSVRPQPDREPTAEHAPAAAAVGDPEERQAPGGMSCSLSEPKWSVDVEVVERRRIVRGWTRLELAKVARVDPKTLRDLLRQSRRPTFGTVQAICTALGLTLPDVVAFNDR
jgi:DNA-binding Xre family transcriptional regulator